MFINLDRAVERRRFVEGQAERLGLAVERFAALRSEDVDDSTFELLSRQWERPLTRVELAVFLSHKALWARAARSRAGLVILEDDVVLSSAITDFLAEAPTGFDLVNLENFDRRKFFRRRGGYQHRGVEVTPIARDKAGAAAYYLSPGGARKLLAAAETAAAPADAFLYRSGRLSVAQAEPALAMQAHILAGCGVEPGIATMTQIHVPRKKLPWTRKNMGFLVRRLATQLDLLRFQILRGLGLVEFRRPRVDLGAFGRSSSFREDPQKRAQATGRPAQTSS
ncbi:glycosyltransferase family 25 protein [Jiella marina]|uniref:glycosyltransferase family 25 protein n=1 Tax=Jiella sp. LLJ827 TaxID=2917712 RepID=UPI0021019D41|nr:glycosyltransferase family 25 protein [Jiella sp. LLJ827]